MFKKLIFLFLVLFSFSANADPISIGLAASAIAGAAAAAAAPTLLAGTIFATTIGAAVFGGIVTATLGLITNTIFKPKTPKFDFGSFQTGITVQTRNADEPHKIIYGTARVSGNIALLQTENSGFRYDGSPKSGDNPFLHVIICLAGHELEEITTVYFDDNALTLDGSGWVTSTPYFRDSVSYARVLKHLGASDQAADSVALTQLTGWDSSCQGKGIAYLYVILEFNTDVFINGVPNISAIVKGKKVYDPRTTLTAWSNNPALCIRDYLTSDYGFNVPTSRIDDVSFGDAADICEESVATAAGGTQDRFTCDGVLTMAQSPIDNMTALTSSVIAPITYTQGKFRCNVAAYNSPVLDITDDMLAGPIKIMPRQERKNLFNSVKGLYADPNNLYVPTSFPTITNATYVAQDGGDTIEKEADFPFLQDPERGQRMAKIILEKSRQGITIEMSLNMSGMQLAVWDVITRTDEDFGWSAKEFRIMSWQFDPQSGVRIYAQEESSAAYDWNAGEATIHDAAPDTNLPNPFSVAAPGAPSVVEALYETIGSAGVKAKATVSWSASSDAFVDVYFVEYKLTSDSDYIVLSATRDTTLIIWDVQPGEYDVRVRARNSLGVFSSYSSSVVSIAGLTAQPADITGFTLNQIHNNAHLAWDQSTDLDVRIGGKIRVRYSPDTSTPTWSNAIDITKALPGGATHAVAPLLTGTYMIKAVDSSGNESASSSNLVSTVANMVNLNAVATQTEDPTFSGTKTNMTVSASKLKLNGSGPFATSGTYEFSTYIDVGAVVTSRVTVDIAGVVSDYTDLFDSRDGLFDDAAGLFDGDDITGVDVSFYLATTNDDPSGSPTWSDWRRFVVGDYTARAFKFKIEVASENEALNIEISALSASVDAPDITDSAVVTTSAGASTTVSFNKNFVAAPNVGATIQNGTTGDFYVISSVTKTGFTLDTYDSALSRKSVNVKWEAHGY